MSGMVVERGALENLWAGEESHLLSVRAHTCNQSSGEAQMDNQELEVILSWYCMRLCLQTEANRKNLT